jgi:carboxyl-terminal processing protease
MTYIKTQDYSYKSNIEIELEKLKKEAEEEQSFGLIKSEYETLLNKLIQDKKDDLLKHKSEICKELETEIVSRYYFQKGRIESNIKNDKDIYQAKLLLSDSFKTETILSKIEKPTKPFNIKKKF